MEFSPSQEKENRKKKSRHAAGLLAFLFLLSSFLTACGSPAEDIGSDADRESWNFVNLGDGSEVSGDSSDISSSGDSSSPADSGSASSENLLSPDTLTLSGHSVNFGEDAAPLLASLGQWREVTALTEEEASSGSGSAAASQQIEAGVSEKLYRYDGMLLHTYPDGGIDRIASVIFQGDTVTTGEGLRVGMPESEIAPLLGGGGKQGNGSYLFRGSDALLQIFVSAGQVSLLRYTDAGYADAGYTGREGGPAPLILLSDITVEAGSAIPYREHIRILDLEDGMIDLYDDSKVQFDGSGADISTVGSYPLTVSAKNDAGKSAKRSFTVFVIPQNITEEMVHDYAASILAGRTQSTMTNEEKLHAVFQYITKESGMQYVDYSDKDNPYYQEAWNGFTTLRGDCYTFCSMSQVLLDCLGVDYYVVTRNGARRSSHYWLLADFGDGWYHFDTCFHSYKWTKETYKLTDGEVAAFTAWYNTKAPGWNYYQFDQSLYPRTPVLNPNGSYTYQSYPVTYAAGEGGSIKGTAEQQVTHGQYSAFVTAVPDDGFAFRRWSDGMSTATRTDLVSGELRVTAEFVPEPE